MLPPRARTSGSKVAVWHEVACLVSCTQIGRSSYRIPDGSAFACLVMGASHDLGRRGEAIAAATLTRRGWTVVARNYRLGHKEIDLVMRRGQLVAFVEVKTRAGEGYGHPLEAVTAAKRREIERVARAWMARHGQPDDVYRFDAVSVICEGSAPPVVEHVEDAWRL